MTIGLPKGLLYYRYGILWENFFTALGCKVLVSDDTNLSIFKQGAQDAVSECCLPAKAYLGHVRSLLGRANYILVPYATDKTGGDAVCVRFWGIGDVVRHTYPGTKLLEYDICKNGSDFHGFKAMGKRLGKGNRMIRSAYVSAVEAQNLHDWKLRDMQKRSCISTGADSTDLRPAGVPFSTQQKNLPISSKLKILVAGHPYVIHDPVIGGPVVKILSELGAVPLYSDRVDPKANLGLYRHISPRLYWTANQEIIGTIASLKAEVDGVLLLSTFPCAPDALAGEMTMRAVKDIPIIPILLDGLQGEAGLVTRLECFVDILSERRNRRAGTIGNFLPPYGQLSRAYRTGAGHAVS